MGQQGSSALSGSNSHDDESKEVSSIPTPTPSIPASSSPVIVNHLTSSDHYQSSPSHHHHNTDSPSKGSYYGSLRVNQMKRKNQMIISSSPHTPSSFTPIISGGGSGVENNNNNGTITNIIGQPSSPRGGGGEMISKRRDIKKKGVGVGGGGGNGGLSLLATSFSRREFKQDLIGDDDESDVTTSRTGLDSTTDSGVFASFRTSRNYLRSNSNIMDYDISKNDTTIGDIVHQHHHHHGVVDHECLSLYPKSHYDYYNRRMHQLIDSYFDREKFDWTIHLDPENDPQFYEIAFSLFAISLTKPPPQSVAVQQYQDVDDVDDDEDDEYEEEIDTPIIDDDYFTQPALTTTMTKSSPRQIQSDEQARQKSPSTSSSGIDIGCSCDDTSTVVVASSAATMPSLVSTTTIMTTTSSTVNSNDLMMSSLANSTTLGSASTSSSTTNYLSSPNPSSFHRPRGRAFLTFGTSLQSPSSASSSSTQQHSYLLHSPSSSTSATTMNNYSTLTNNLISPTTIPPLLQSNPTTTTKLSATATTTVLPNTTNTINTINTINTTSTTTAPCTKTIPVITTTATEKKTNIPLKLEKKIPKSPRECRRECYLKVLNARFEYGGWKDSNFGKKTISLSQLEESVPYEIMFHILSYLSPEDLIDLSRVSRSFHYIWTEHPLLWISYPYTLRNLGQNNAEFENSSVEFVETFEDSAREKKQGSSFIDHLTLRELIESSPFTPEKTTMILSSWKNIYKSIYKGYRNGPWMNYCSFQNNVNTQSLEYRLSMIEIKVCLIGDSTCGKSSWVYMLREAISNNQLIDSSNVEHRSRVKKIEYMEPTIGASYSMKHVIVNLPNPMAETNQEEDDDSISSEADSYIMTRYNPIISLSVWDTSGVKRYYSLIPLYLKVCKAIMLCFDLNRQESFDDMLQLFDKYIFKQQVSKSPELHLLENRNLFEKCLQNEDIYVFVCGLKSDLEPKISNERITQFLHCYGGSRIKLFTNNMLYFELSSMSGENLYTPWLHLAYRVALKNQSDGASSSASSSSALSSISGGNN